MTVCTDETDVILLDRLYLKGFVFPHQLETLDLIGVAFVPNGLNYVVSE